MSSDGSGPRLAVVTGSGPPSSVWVRASPAEALAPALRWPSGVLLGPPASFSPRSGLSTSSSLASRTSSTETPCPDFGQRHRKVLSGRKRRGLDGMDEIDVVLLDLADHVQGYKNLEAPATRNQATAAGILEEKIEPKARLKLAKPRGTAVAGIASGKVKARGTIARCLSKSRTPSAARRPNTSTAAASSSSQAASSSHGARSVPWATGKEPHDPLDAFRDRGPGLKMLRRTINELKEQKLPARRRKTAPRDTGRDRRRPASEEQQRHIVQIDLT